jgi:hypothetical protein
LITQTFADRDRPPHGHDPSGAASSKGRRWVDVLESATSAMASRANGPASKARLIVLMVPEQRVTAGGNRQRSSFMKDPHGSG